MSEEYFVVMTIKRIVILILITRCTASRHASFTCYVHFYSGHIVDSNACSLDLNLEFKKKKNS